MDGGWADYKRSLSGFSSFDSGIQTLKDKAKADKTKVFEMDKLNLGDEALQVGQIKSTLDTVGESAGGLATTMLSVRSFGAMKKHLKNISNKLGGKESKESPGEKNSTAEKEAPTEEEANPTGDTEVSGTRNIQTGEEGDVAPRAQDVDVPERPSAAGQEVEMRDMSTRGGEADPTEGETFESGDVGSNIEGGASNSGRNLGQNSFHESVADDPSSTAPFTRTPEDTLGTQTETTATDTIGDTTADIAGDAAADAAADVAADASVGAFAQIFDAIPIVGEVIGAAVGIGAAIAGGVEAGKEAADEKLEEADSKAELSINAASAVSNKFGNSVTPTLTSLAQMPSNSGIF